MSDYQISDEELQLYFNYLMQNNGVLNVNEFNAFGLDNEDYQYSTDELALEVV